MHYTVTTSITVWVSNVIHACIEDLQFCKDLKYYFAKMEKERKILKALTHERKFYVI